MYPSIRSLVRVTRKSCLALGLSFLVVTTSCSRSTSTGSDASSGVIVRDDISTLGKVIHLPPTGVRSARWAIVPIGIESVVGPTDYVLYAYLELDAASWSSLHLANSRDGGAKTVRLRADVAHLLLGPFGAELPGDSRYKFVTGTAYDTASFERSPYRGTEGVRVHDGLLLVLGTM